MQDKNYIMVGVHRNNLIMLMTKTPDGTTTVNKNRYKPKTVVEIAISV